jgi:mannose-6-phosphate isomerase-like protein (cupin superfamily)
MMETTHGTWGERTITWKDDFVLVTILRLEPKKRCSWHKHAHSYNQFYVIEGELVVKTDIGPDNQRNLSIITKGQSFTVAPGVFHEFRTRDKYTVVEEIAYVKYDSSDIHRLQLGGNCLDALREDEDQKEINKQAKAVFHSEDESWLRPDWKQQAEQINRGSFNAS